MGYSCAAIVGADAEGVVVIVIVDAEGVHYVYAVLGHGALGVCGVGFIAGSFGGGAVASQVYEDNGVRFDQLVGDQVPDVVNLRVAVDEE